jgi:hypothetical protein
MLTADVVEDAKRLLASGLSVRAVARRTGAGRSSVLAIKNGKRTSRFAGDVDRVTEAKAAAEAGIDPPTNCWLWSVDDGYQLRRCCGCGARAFIRERDGGRCMACRVRSLDA